MTKNMTEKEYWKWARRFKRAIKKECLRCKKSHNGAYGVLCEHCRNEWQIKINMVKKQVKERK